MPRGVGRSAGLAAACAATVIASFVAGKAARDAILLANFDVTSLPMFVGIAAAISIPLVLVIGRLMVRFGPVRLFVVLNGASAALLVAEWLVFQTEPAMPITYGTPASLRSRNVEVTACRLCFAATCKLRRRESGR